MIQDKRLSIEESVNDFREIATHVKGPRVILVLPPPTRIGQDVNLILDQLRQELKNAAIKSNVDVIDTGQLLGDSTGLLRSDYSADGVHLTQEAYHVLGKKIKDVLSKSK